MKAYEKFLKEMPETEMDYWESIEALGGLSWGLNHDLAHNRMDDPDGAIANDILNLQDASVALVTEVQEKFNVVMTKEEVVDGKEYYWDWYNRWKAVYHQSEYEGMICSACPYSKGFEYMMHAGGQVPCGRLRGWMSRLTVPFECGLIGMGDLTEEKLISEMTTEHGEDAAKLFLEKKVALEEKLKK